MFDKLSTSHPRHFIVHDDQSYLVLTGLLKKSFNGSGHLLAIIVKADRFFELEFFVKYIFQSNLANEVVFEDKNL